MNETGQWETFAGFFSFLSQRISFDTGCKKCKGPHSIQNSLERIDDPRLH